MSDFGRHCHHPLRAASQRRPDLGASGAFPDLPFSASRSRFSKLFACFPSWRAWVTARNDQHRKQKPAFWVGYTASLESLASLCLDHRLPFMVHRWRGVPVIMLGHTWSAQGTSKVEDAQMAQKEGGNIIIIAGFMMFFPVRCSPLSCASRPFGFPSDNIVNSSPLLEINVSILIHSFPLFPSPFPAFSKLFFPVRLPACK